MDNAFLWVKPDDPYIFNILGAAFSAIENVHEAKKYFHQAVILAPDYVEAHNNLAIKLQDLEMDKKALQHRKRAICYLPSYSDPYIKVIDNFISAEENMRAILWSSAAKSLK